MQKCCFDDFSLAVLSARLLLTFLRCVQFLARNHAAVTILTISDMESVAGACLAQRAGMASPHQAPPAMSSWHGKGELDATDTDRALVKL